MLNNKCLGHNIPMYRVKYIPRAWLPGVDVPTYQVWRDDQYLLVAGKSDMFLRVNFEGSTRSN